MSAVYALGPVGWLQQHLATPGRLPLTAFLTGLLAAFFGIRGSVRLIRAGVRWWPGNVRFGGLHVHHAVFGLALMVAAGTAGLALTDVTPARRALLALFFGVGTGLVLDEFALILHLEDVYWTRRGLVSVDVVFAVVALSVMVLLGFRPLGLYHWGAPGRKPDAPAHTLVALGSLALAAATLCKGKVWTAFAGVFCLPLLVVGAFRLSRPRALWARRWYAGRSPGRQRRAEIRERRLRAPAVAAKVRVQEWLAGRHDHSEPERAAVGLADRT